MNLKAALRTNESFRNRLNPQHHKSYSIMEMLEIDMIKDFPIADPLHLLELGLMKRCDFVIYIRIK